MLESPKHILPIAERLPREVQLHIQIVSSTGISADYINRIGIARVSSFITCIDGIFQLTGDLSESKEMAQRLLSVLPDVVSYDQFIELKLSELEKSGIGQHLNLKRDDFISEKNQQTVDRLNELANLIPKTVRPRDGVDLDLSQLFEYLREAEGLIRGPTHAQNFSSDRLQEAQEILTKAGLTLG